MRALQVFWTFLTQLVAINIAMPGTNSHIATRGLRQQTCANSPKTIAGTLLTRRTTQPYNPTSRANAGTILWCAHNSRTYVIFTVANAITTNGIPNILDGVCGLCLSMVQRYGDHVIAGGLFHWVGEDGLELRVRNTNNHQTTYGVLGAAMSALGEYMAQNGYAAGGFSVYDGLNQVGEGTIGPVW